MAACIMIVVCAGALMPSLIKTAENGDVTYRYGAASIISEAPAAGYVIMGLMSFALGVCLTLVIFRLRGAEKKRKTEEEVCRYHHLYRVSRRERSRGQ